MKNMLIFLLLVIAVFLDKPAMAQQGEEPIPFGYGEIDVDSFTVPPGIAQYQIYGFDGEAGDVVDIVFEFTRIEGLSGTLVLTDLTTGREYKGTRPLFDFFNLYLRFSLEDFRLPSTGSYVIYVEVYDPDDTLTSSVNTDYAVTLDGKRIKDKQLFQALSIYTIGYQQIFAEVGKIQPGGLTRVALLQIGKEPVVRPSIHFGEFCPSFSPDGKTVIYGGYESMPMGIEGIAVVEPAVAIYSRPVNSASKTIILEDLKGGTGVPRFSPDGTQIAFHQRTDKDIYEVFIFDTKTKVSTQVTDFGARSRYPFWSPDGKKLMFHSDVAGNYDIYTIALDGTDVRRLTNSPGDEFRAMYSPDGKQILYTVENKDIDSLFLMDSTGANQRSLPSPPHSTSLGWTPDGKWILFQSYVDEDSDVESLYFIRPTGGSPVRITDPFHSDGCGTVSPIIAGQATPTPVPTRPKP